MELLPVQPKKIFQPNSPRFTFEPYLESRFCHTVVPPSTVTLRRAAFHSLKSSAGLSTSLFSTSKAKEVLEEEERTQRGDQEIDMMAASDNATCHMSFSTEVVFPYHNLVVNSADKDIWLPPPFAKDKTEEEVQ